MATIVPIEAAELRRRIERFQQVHREIVEQVRRVIVGQEEVLEQVLIALFVGGHCLITGLPGTAKTLLVRTIAQTLGLAFKRIQFTPDLMPSDITGTDIIEEDPATGRRTWTFVPGPIFANVLLADEINRATPRTQSALLEAMEERQVTAEGETRKLPRPFFVLATENPIELEGTFPLPEAQLDRFLMRISLGYPSRDEEKLVARRFQVASPLDDLKPVLGASELPELVRACRRVFVSEAVEDYLVDVVRASREATGVTLGASPRATLALFRGSQALAAIHGRDYVLPDDVKRLVGPVLGHRLILTAQGRLRGQGAAEVVAQVLARVPAPVEDGVPVGG